VTSLRDIVGKAGAGRVALVTGTGGGLGGAVVAELEAAGWTVAASAHRDGPWACDVADRPSVDLLVERVGRDFGRLDLVVSNAATMTMGPVDVQPIDDWWRVVEVNLSGAFYLARAAAPLVRAALGSLVFVSSEWGVTGWPNATAYAASKAGLLGLTRALARELAPEVRVNAIAPGVIDTPQLNVDAAWEGVALDEMRRRYAEAVPLRRIASPGEIAWTVAFLASPAGSFYTGQVLQPNGGSTMA
jgi:NAD(P)-dependent dehydrogenase (short-subunit alcohol dehydrogenase family)